MNIATDRGAKAAVGVGASPCHGAATSVEATATALHASAASVAVTVARRRRTACGRPPFPTTGRTPRLITGPAGAGTSAEETDRALRETVFRAFELEKSHLFDSVRKTYRLRRESEPSQITKTTKAKKIWCNPKKTILQVVLNII